MDVLPEGVVVIAALVLWGDLSILDGVTWLD